MKAIHVKNPGPESILEIQETPTPKPGPQEILVKIEATAANRADLFQRKGNYAPPEGAPDIPGLEMAGIVEKIGTKVTRWKTGDFVFGLLPGGGYAEFCTIHEKLAMPIPETMSFKEAAAIPETFLTAYLAIRWLGDLHRAGTVLIHAGGSGVGTSAIQLARQLFNAQIIATAGQQQKLDTCTELGADFVYNYKEQDFAEEIGNDVGENSINLILDFIGAPYWEKNLQVLAMDGRLVLLAFLGGHQLEQMSLAPLLNKRLSVIASTLRSRSESYKIRLTQEFAEHTLDLFEEEIIKPVIDSTYDWHDLEAAHQHMSENRNTGKIVITGM